MSESKGFFGKLSQVLGLGGKGSDGVLSPESVKIRRRLVGASILGFLGINLLMFMRFFFPRTLFEPKTVFKAGYPADFAFGVDTKFQKDHRIWIVRNAEGLIAIFARCTHLGCTPD